MRSLFSGAVDQTEVDRETAEHGTAIEEDPNAAIAIRDDKDAMIAALAAEAMAFMNDIGARVTELDVETMMLIGKEWKLFPMRAHLSVSSRPVSKPRRPSACPFCDRLVWPGRKSMSISLSVAEATRPSAGWSWNEAAKTSQGRRSFWHPE